jgi:hypothetical protein
MNQITRSTLLLSISLLIFSCSGNGDCTKTITIPELVITSPTGTSYNPAYKIEVPCDYEVTPIKELDKLQNFTYEVIQFQFTPDTGNNTSRLQFKIKLNNPNNYAVKGTAKITIDADGVVSSSNFASAASLPCDQIEAKSSCALTFDKENSLNLGLVKSIKLVNVEFLITK